MHNRRTRNIRGHNIIEIGYICNCQTTKEIICRTKRKIHLSKGRNGVGSNKKGCFFKRAGINPNISVCSMD